MWCNVVNAFLPVGCVARSNNLPIDIFGLYREVIRHGGFVDNERYDDYNRWTGGINFGGKVRDPPGISGVTLQNSPMGVSIIGFWRTLVRRCFQLHTL